MPERVGWREMWDPARVELMERTARKFVQQRHEAMPGRQRSWADLPERERWAATEGIAHFFVALVAAFDEMSVSPSQKDQPDG